MRSFVLGFSFIGMNLYMWYYKLLPWLFSNALPAWAVAYPNLTTIILDQLVFAPYIVFPVMYGYSILEV